MSLHYILSQHLLPLITLSYIAGIFASTLPVEFSNTIIHYYPFICLNGIFLLLCKTGWRKTIAVLLMLLFLQVGIYSATIAQQHPSSPHHIYTIISQPQEAVITGTIKRLYSFNGETSRFDLHAHAMRTKFENSQPITGNIRYSIAGELSQKLIPGNMVAVRAKLKRPQRYLTAGSFDYPGYLAQHDIYITGFIRSPFHLQPIDTQHSTFQHLLLLPERLRMQINHFVDSTLSGDRAAIYKALLTGDRNAITPATLENFKSSGCMHILAISGIHMSLLGVFLFSVFFWLLRRSSWLILNIDVKKAAVILCIIPLVFYAFIAGAKQPVLRALFMSLMVIGAVCYGKKHSFAGLVSLAALCLLSFSPLALFTPSFQLTFAAVIAIAAVIPWLTAVNNTIGQRFSSQFIHKSLQWLVAGCVVSAAATVGTAPLLIFHFNRISLVGVVANLAVEPVICLWSLLLGFAAIPCIWIFPSLAAFFLNIGGVGIQCAQYVAEFFASLPYSSLHLPTISPGHLIIFYLCLIFLYLSSSFPAIVRHGTAFVLCITTFLMLISPAEITKKTTTESTLTFIDIGQGSCTLLELPGGKRALIDGGAITSPGFDSGKQIIAPFLFSKGIQKIDTIIITHADSDHYSGITHVLKHFNVSILWINQINIHAAGWHDMLETAKKHEVEVQVPKDGEIIINGNEASLQVLVSGKAPRYRQKRNDGSMVLKYRHDNFSALFPGDITASRERELAKAGLDLHSTVLLAAHHGSATSSTPLFIKTVTPDIIIASSGRSWRRSFPSQKLSAQCEKLGIDFLPTSKFGSIRLKTKAGKYEVHTFRPMRL